MTTTRSPCFWCCVRSRRKYRAIYHMIVVITRAITLTFGHFVRGLATTWWWMVAMLHLLCIPGLLFLDQRLWDWRGTQHVMEYEGEYRLISTASCLDLLPVYLLLLFELSFPFPDGCIVYRFLRKVTTPSWKSSSFKSKQVFDWLWVSSHFLNLFIWTQLLSVQRLTNPDPFHSSCTRIRSFQYPYPLRALRGSLVHRPDTYYFMSPQNSKMPSAYNQKTPSDDDDFWSTEYSIFVSWSLLHSIWHNWVLAQTWHAEHSIPFTWLRLGQRIHIIDIVLSYGKVLLSHLWLFFVVRKLWQSHLFVRRTGGWEVPLSTYLGTDIEITTSSLWGGWKSNVHRWELSWCFHIVASRYLGICHLALRSC